MARLVGTWVLGGLLLPSAGHHHCTSGGGRRSDGLQVSDRDQ
jgi:hypothetical protein